MGWIEIEQGKEVHLREVGLGVVQRWGVRARQIQHAELRRIAQLRSEHPKEHWPEIWEDNEEKRYQTPQYLEGKLDYNLFVMEQAVLGVKGFGEELDACKDPAARAKALEDLGFGPQISLAVQGVQRLTAEEHFRAEDGGDVGSDESGSPAVDDGAGGGDRAGNGLGLSVRGPVSGEVGS